MSHVSTAICDPEGRAECPRLKTHGPKTCQLCLMLAYCAKGANAGKDQHWHCTRCGLGNELKFCSNCGEERPR